MKFMFSLQHPLTCKPSTTLPNPCNKMREVNIFLKKSSGVFLHASVFVTASFIFIIIESLWVCNNWSSNSHTTMSESCTLATKPLELLHLRVVISLLKKYCMSSVRQWSGRSEFNPESSHMVLDATWLNTQHYKVRIKGKVEQSREWSSSLPYTSV